MLSFPREAPTGPPSILARPCPHQGTQDQTSTMSQGPRIVELGT